MSKPSDAIHALTALVASLALLMVGAPEPAAAQTGIVCGQAVNGAISAPLEQDVYTFFGEQGDLVTITLVDTGAIDPGFALFGQLFNPDGTGRGTLGPFHWFLTQTGTHTVRIRSSTNTTRGNYALRVGWLLPVAKQCGDHTSLACGVAVNGSIAAPLEQDVFTFFGEQGDRVSLTLVRTGDIDAGFAVLGQAFNPDGTGRGTVGPFDLILTQTGNHVVLVRDSSHVRRGTYAIRQASLRGCPADSQPPGPPGNLTAQVAGSSVAFGWTAPTTGGGVTSYVLEASASPAGATVATVDTASILTAFTVLSVPQGTYYVRVRGRNAVGLGATSIEVVVMVGGGCSPPAPPLSLGASVTGQSVMLTWVAPSGAVSDYVIEGGSSPGASDLASLPTGNANTVLVATAPRGTYYVRVRARNACGTSGSSNEVVVMVP